MAENPIIGKAKCHACGKPVQVKAFKGGTGNAYYFCGNIRDDGEFCHGHARWGGPDSRKMKAQAAVAERKAPKPANDDAAIANDNKGVSDDVRTNFLGL